MNILKEAVVALLLNIDLFVINSCQKMFVVIETKLSKRLIVFVFQKNRLDLIEKIVVEFYDKTFTILIISEYVFRKRQHI